VTPLNVPGLLWPSGLAAGADGSLYTSNCSVEPFCFTTRFRTR